MKDELRQKSDQSQDAFLKKLELITNALQTRKQRISNAKNAIGKNNDTCLQELKSKKEDILNMFDELIENVSNKTAEQNKDIDGDFSAIDESLKKLDRMKEDLQDPKLTDEERTKIMQETKIFDDNFYHLLENVTCQPYKRILGNCILLIWPMTSTVIFCLKP